MTPGRNGRAVVLGETHAARGERREASSAVQDLRLFELPDVLDQRRRADGLAGFIGARFEGALAEGFDGGTVEQAVLA